MVNIQEFQQRVIGVTSDRTAVLLDGSPSRYRVMDSPVLGDHCQPEGFDSMPNSPGLYAATIEYWWHPDLSSGMPAHGDFFAKDMKRVSIEGLATDRYRRCLESSGVVGCLASVRSTPTSRHSRRRASDPVPSAAVSSTS
jgi:hypothetical protein